MRKIYLFVLVILGFAYIPAALSESQASCEDIYYTKHVKNYDDKMFINKSGSVIDAASAFAVYSSTLGGAAIGGAIGAPIGGAAAISTSIGTTPFTVTGGVNLTQMYLNDANQEYVYALHIIQEAKMGDGFHIRALFNDVNGNIVLASKKLSSLEELVGIILDQDQQLGLCQNNETMTYDELITLIVNIKNS